jgi:hypothetical protein
MAQGSAGPIVWPTFDLEIPTTSPAAVAAPPMSTWLAAAAANHAALDGSAVDIGGMALRDLRRAARREAADAALDYTRGLGVPAGAAGAGATDLVFATGHQPLLAHPGIWVKYLALARLVPPGALGLNLIVDSDAADEIAAEVPLERGGLQRSRVVLAQGGPNTPIEAIPDPDAGGWLRFASAIDERVGTISEHEVGAGWSRARALFPPRSGGGLAGAITTLRRGLEGPRPYLDLPVSRLAATPSFRRFAYAIIRDAGRFALVHNACLDAYREHYGVRTAAQPFPDLLLDADRLEAPFWYVADGRRWPLFVDPLGRRLIAGDRDVGPLPDHPDEAGFAEAPIRPRALTLTAYARLALSDLFIHGVGGGRYDRATDAVVRAFFDIVPPAYATITATLFLPFGEQGSPEAERQRLHRLLLDLQHNPDRFLESDGAHHALVDEKWDLIRRLERADGLTRRERRAATRRIRELNAILQVAVAERVADAQQALDRLSRRQADADVTGYRGYPFLLHRVEAVEALVDLGAGEPGPGGGGAGG